jgi:Cellulase (glycosyl hydrolase family 5)
MKSVLCRSNSTRGAVWAIRFVTVVILFLGVVPMSSTSASAAPLSIRVQGNHLVNQNGKTIRLLGVDRSGAEYECVTTSQVFDGPSNAASVKAMVSWHINAVRVPLNEDCWLGINGVVTGGAAYREQIVQYVHTLETFGLYVILDLHWAAPASNVAASQWPMADADHSPAFWTSVATTFKSNHAVLFDLFNEPYGISWPCWLSGCQATYGSPTVITYQTAGMQQLVDAVRSTGATTPLMLGGLGYANDLTGWRQNEPTDPDHQLVVSFHTYNFGGCDYPSCWATNVVPLAKVVPVVTGEFGEDKCGDSFDLAFMPWADQHGISYLGWAWDATDAGWDCSGGPSLIADYGGKPTTYGVALKNHLAKLAKLTKSSK